MPKKPIQKTDLKERIQVRTRVRTSPNSQANFAGEPNPEKQKRHGQHALDHTQESQERFGRVDTTKTETLMRQVHGVLRSPRLIVKQSAGVSIQVSQGRTGLGEAGEADEADEAGEADKADWVFRRDWVFWRDCGAEETTEQQEHHQAAPL